MSTRGFNTDVKIIRPPDMDLPTWTVQEVADYLRLHKMSVYRMIKRGEIPSFRIGRKVRIQRDDVLKRFEARALRAI